MTRAAARWPKSGILAAHPSPARLAACWWRRPGIILTAILLASAALRLGGLGNSPPGLNQDEAANAWNAWCLLKTGTDQVGASWPILYAHALACNRSTLYFYLLMPFQAVGGLNAVTTRLPAALGGVLTVWLIYAVARRLFDRPTGLLAAGLLALNPWHLFLSRWGHEANIVPMLILAPLAMMLWAGLPPAKCEPARPLPWRAGLAGLVAGAACYGYPAVRMALPVMIAGLACVAWRQWRQAMRTRRGAVAVLAFVIGALSLAGPLAWQHVVNGEVIARRAAQTRIWRPGTPPFTIARQLAWRYARHYGPDFLFIRGDRWAPMHPPVGGEFHAYALPLMAAGVVVLATGLRRRPAARLLLVWLAVFPLSDVFFGHVQGSIHAQRSSTGLPALILLAALGGRSAIGALWRRRRGFALAVVAALVVLAAAINARFLAAFFGPFNRDAEVCRLMHADLLEACRWLKGRLDRTDAVFFTVGRMRLPYIVTFVALDLDSARWLAEPRLVDSTGEWDHYLRAGKLHFLYDRRALDALGDLERNGRGDRVILIVRPMQIRHGPPDRRIVGPDGRDALWIYDRTL